MDILFSRRRRSKTPGNVCVNGKLSKAHYVTASAAADFRGVPPSRQSSLVRWVPWIEKLVRDGGGDELINESSRSRSHHNASRFWCFSGSGAPSRPRLCMLAISAAEYVHRDYGLERLRACSRSFRTECDYTSCLQSAAFNLVCFLSGTCVDSIRKFFFSSGW